MATTVEYIKDYHGEEAEVKVRKFCLTDGDLHLISLDFDANDMTYTDKFMLYTPDQARQLAAYLMEAAHRADKGVL
jgi:hypothetical protein